MQKIVLEDAYVHVPPKHGPGWSRLLAPILPWFLRQNYGIVKYEFVGQERLRASLAAGHGVVLMPNHCRDEDGLVMGQLSCHLRSWFYYMASWHVFKGSRVQAFFLAQVGVFSVYREGADRAAVKTSVQILLHARRPVVIFPEGYLGRTNDRLNPLMDGAALIACSAAKFRAQMNPPGRVVVHPVAIRYRLAGPLQPGVDNVLAEMEERLGLTVGVGQPLRARLDKIEEAMLAKLEIEQVGQRQSGSVIHRRAALIDQLLGPLEREWDEKPPGPESVQSRVRRLRVSIVPGLVKGGLTEAERQRLWRQLSNIYLAQQLDNYPSDYLTGEPTPERLLETIERFEEDLTDRVRPHVRLAVTVTIGEAIVVDTAGAHRGGSELLGAVEAQLRTMLGIAPAPGLTAPREKLPH